MAQQPPIALVVFSNDLDSYLAETERERKIIEEALEHYHDSNRLKVITRSSVSVKEIFRLFNRYQGRIALFHFAGHASGQGLQLNDSSLTATTGNAKGLAQLFEQEVKDGQLQLVFLNGCSTMPQVEGLQNAGIQNIIATHCPINDTHAVEFAQQFYKTLASTDQSNPFSKSNTIQQSFDAALAFLNTTDDFSVEKSGKGLKLRRTKKEYKAPWVFFSELPDWILPNEQAEKHKVFNEYLTRKTLEALKPYIPSAAKFFIIANQKDPVWETSTGISDFAKDIIALSFGLIGIQLRKLMAIGKEAHSETKVKKYIRNSILTGKRILKIVCFNLLSTLWDAQKENNYQLSENQINTLKSFFDSVFDLNIKSYYQLFRTLMIIFQEQNITLPIEELSQLYPHLTDNSSFSKSIDKFQEVYDRLEKSKHTLADCFVAERKLSAILEKFAFLSVYDLSSIKDVGFAMARNQPQLYSHKFAILGLNKKLQAKAEKTVYTDKTVHTDAVIFFKDDYLKGYINLYPFIIDMNVLLGESGSKVCFYHSKSLAGKSLNFSFLEDNSLQNIEYQSESSDDDSKDIEKLDSLYLQFIDAQETILQSASKTEEEDLSDFGDLLDDF